MQKIILKIELVFQSYDVKCTATFFGRYSDKFTVAWRRLEGMHSSECGLVSVLFYRLLATTTIGLTPQNTQHTTSLIVPRV